MPPSPPERDTQIDLIWTPQTMRAERLAAPQNGGYARGRLRAPVTFGDEVARLPGGCQWPPAGRFRCLPASGNGRSPRWRPGLPDRGWRGYFCGGARGWG